MFVCSVEYTNDCSNNFTLHKTRAKVVEDFKRCKHQRVQQNCGMKEPDGSLFQDPSSHNVCAANFQIWREVSPTKLQHARSHRRSSPVFETTPAGRLQGDRMSPDTSQGGFQDATWASLEHNRTRSSCNGELTFSSATSAGKGQDANQAFRTAKSASEESRITPMELSRR